MAERILDDMLAEFRDAAKPWDKPTYEPDPGVKWYVRRGSSGRPTRTGWQARVRSLDKPQVVEARRLRESGTETEWRPAGAVDVVVQAGDYWVSEQARGFWRHVPAAEFEAQYIELEMPGDGQ